MRLPNFFILGAPKCGTTSLASWLGDHPQVFMSLPKEPHYFNTDSSHREVRTAAGYARLFRSAQPWQTAVGEASVYYLHSSIAVSNIERAIDRPRYIVMLRNPVEMAPALHAQKVRSASEHIEDFAAAWGAQDDRRAGRQINRFCQDPAHLVYSEVCRLGEQLQRLYAAVPRERVLTILLEDLSARPGEIYRQTLRFLGVEDDHRAEFPVLNRAAVPRSRLLNKAIRFGYDTRVRLGLPSLGGPATRWAHRMNSAPRAPSPLPQALLTELQHCFADDVALLSRLLERDLDHWLAARAPAAGVAAE